MKSDALTRNLRNLMFRRGYNQPDLERHSGVPQGTISRIVTGRHNTVRLETAVALARALGTTVSQLIGEVPMNPDDTMTRVLVAMEKMPEYRREDLARISDTFVNDPKTTRQ